MFYKPDAIGYDAHGHLSVVVEAKGRMGTTRSWATQKRHDMLTRGNMPNGKYFLLATPDRLYLWKDAAIQSEGVEPTYEIDSTPIFRPYYEKAGLTPDTVRGQGFELIVNAWLFEISRFGVSTTVPAKERAALEESGLVNALKDGHIAVEVTA
jgi:hypothetical protein